VNIQSDVIHMVSEEPPWLFSESASPLSSAYAHLALLTDLSFKQYTRNPYHRSLQPGSGSRLSNLVYVLAPLAPRSAGPTKNAFCALPTESISDLFIDAPGSRFDLYESLPCGGLKRMPGSFEPACNAPTRFCIAPFAERPSQRRVDQRACAVRTLPGAGGKC
jgi:hypothetical protein